MTCYSDHNEDIRTKGSCDYCHDTMRECDDQCMRTGRCECGSVMIAYALLLVMPVIFLATLAASALSVVTP